MDFVLEVLFIEVDIGSGKEIRMWQQSKKMRYTQNSWPASQTNSVFHFKNKILASN